MAVAIAVAVAVAVAIAIAIDVAIAVAIARVVAMAIVMAIAVAVVIAIAIGIAKAIAIAIAIGIAIAIAIAIAVAIAMAIAIAIAIAVQEIPTGCTYVGFKLPGKSDIVRRDAYDYGRANISGCKAMLCPMRDKLLQCSKRKTTCPSAHQPIRLGMFSPSQQYCQTCKAWGQ
jgi:hypothetical protein